MHGFQCNFFLVTQSIVPFQQTFTWEEVLRDKPFLHSRLHVWHAKETKSCDLLHLCRFRIVVTSVVILILAILWRYQESDNVRLVMDSVTGQVTIMRDRVISLGTPLQNFMQKIYQRGKSWHTRMILYNDEESSVCASPREIQASQNDESAKFTLLSFCILSRDPFLIRILFPIFNWESITFFAPKSTGAINPLTCIHEALAKRLLRSCKHWYISSFCCCC